MERHLKKERQQMDSPINKKRARQRERETERHRERERERERDPNSSDSPTMLGPFSPTIFGSRLGLHEEVPIHLGLSSQLHQLRGVVRVFLAKQSGGSGGSGDFERCPLETRKNPTA